MPDRGREESGYLELRLLPGRDWTVSPTCATIQYHRGPSYKTIDRQSTDVRERTMDQPVAS